MADPQLKLLELPTTELLDKFGAGSHKPGSGSAAALMGILAGKLMCTVCRLSADKPKYKKHKAEFEYIVKSIEDDIEGQLRHIFQHDAEVFDKVIKLRVAKRDAKSDSEKRKYSKLHLEEMREATEIPFQIAELCFKLIDHGIFLFDLGFQSARGDSGAAVSSAIAGVSSAVFVIGLNLESFKRSSDWKSKKEAQCEELLLRLQDKQLEAFSRITTLTEQELEEMEFDLDN